MRLPLLVIVPLLIVNILVDLYICRAVDRRCKHGVKFWRPFAVWSSVLLSAGMILLTAWPKKSGADADLANMMWMLFAYLSIYIPKYLFIIIDLIGKLPQLWHRPRIPGSSAAAFIIAVISFGLMWWGALVNRFRIDVNEIEIMDPGLPAAFDGLRIVQISDLHTGTFGSDTSFVSKLTATVNGLEPDLVLFTGDIVNRRSDELAPFVSTLSRLNGKEGVYSVLGNHDYGDYYNWPDSAAKSANMALLTDMQKQMGWHLLNNATAMLHRGNDSIALIGVENIGDPPFHIYGDLDAAYDSDLADDVYKILMSHNPAHWLDDIKSSPDKNIALTLSGHTHAMQMELFGLSPAALRYPTWGGLYDDGDGHRLYVNIGSGTVGIPARIGATPEITLITIRKQ